MSRPASATGNYGDEAAPDPATRKKAEILAHVASNGGGSRAKPQQTGKRKSLLPDVKKDGRPSAAAGDGGNRKTKSELNVFKSIWSNPVHPVAAKANAGECTGAGDGQAGGNWIKRNIIGRTPSLPSSLGKKKIYFFKVGLIFSIYTCVVRATV